MASITKQLPVFEIMTKKVIVANINSRFSKVQELFLNFNAHHLPVMDGEVLVGIISDFDLLRAYAQTLEGMGNISKEYLDDIFKVADWMTKNPMVVHSNTTLAEAFKILTEHAFEALPVVDDGTLVGIVTIKDLVSYVDQVLNK